MDLLTVLTGLTVYKAKSNRYNNKLLNSKEVFLVNVNYSTKKER